MPDLENSPDPGFERAALRAGLVVLGLCAAIFAVGVIVGAILG